jgi:hypothetical protein
VLVASVANGRFHDVDVDGFKALLRTASAAPLFVPAGGGSCAVTAPREDPGSDAPTAGVDDDLLADDDTFYDEDMARESDDGAFAAVDAAGGATEDDVNGVDAMDDDDDDDFDDLDDADASSTSAKASS